MRKFLPLFALSLIVCMNTWAIDCDKAISDCVSKYREELAENKRAAKEIYKNPKNKIDISDYFYKGEKVCNEEVFDIGGECQGAKLEENEYSQWKQKISESHAKDLVNMIKQDIKDFKETEEDIKDLAKVVEEGVSASFELGKKYIHEIKNDLEEIIQKGSSRSEVNERIKSIVQLKIDNEETYKVKLLWSVINSLYKDFDGMRFDESKLQCFEPKCFNLVINNKLKDLESEKSRFLNNTKSILEHIKS